MSFSLLRRPLILPGVRHHSHSPAAKASAPQGTASLSPSRSPLSLQAFPHCMVLPRHTTRVNLSAPLQRPVGRSACIVALSTATDSSRGTQGNSNSSRRTETAALGVRPRPGDEFFKDDGRPVVLYDGVCNFCNAGVNFVLDNDKTGKLRLAALQSPAGRTLLLRSGRASDDISSILLVEKDRSYMKSEAVLRIGKLLDIPLAALAPLALLVPKMVSDTLYDTVATNRYNILGKRDECRLDDGTFSDRFLSQ